ncbi:unnamed protein product, partial [Meganyctiphanes norvegica]
ENLHLTLGGNPSPLSNEEDEILTEAKSQNINQHFNSRFTMKELTTCINELPPNKATGEDEVHNMFLKKLPTAKQQELLGMINHSWTTGEIPETWKNSLIIPILKPTKEPTDPNSYRPVSLISCVSKTIEKMVNKRLYWHLESNNSFSETQCGFRKKRSTEDILIGLEHQIRSSLINKKST